MYYPGKYISILPNGDITVTKNKADESTHFYVHIIHVHQFNGQAQALVVQSSVANQPSVQSAAVATNESFAPAQSTGLSQKEEESREAARQQVSASNNPTTSQSSEQINQLDHVSHVVSVSLWNYFLICHLWNNYIIYIFKEIKLL